MLKALAIISAGAVLTGCGTANNYLAEKTKSVEYYRIYDIKTSAPKKDVIKAASNGLGRNVNNSQESTPIPTSATPPDSPGRFTLVNPFKGTNMSAFAHMAGVSNTQIATCENSAWTAKAERRVAGSNRLSLTACLFPYKEGYHLNLYAVFVKQEGGLLQISRDMANAMVGTPEEWTEKTFLDVVRNINANVNAKIALLEAEPELAGTPWLDPVDTPARK